MPWLEIAVALVMLLGLLGTIVPVMPGLAVVWLAGLAYGLAAGFGTVGAVCFTLMTLLALTGTAAKFALPAHGGARRGAPRQTLAAALVGALLGAVLLPALGLPIGALVGAWAGERARLGDGAEAWRTTMEIVRGLGLGILTEFSLGVVMLVTWLVWALAR